MNWPSAGSQLEKKPKPFACQKVMTGEPLPVTNLHPQNIRVRDWMRDSDFEKYGKRLRTVENTGSGGRIRTFDLRVMSYEPIGSSVVIARDCIR